MGELNLMIFHNSRSCRSCSSFHGKESLTDVPHPRRTKGNEVSPGGHKRSFNEE